MKVVILRGVSGCGKSYVAETIAALSPDKTVICCADDYFVDSEGNYNFDVKKLWLAHKSCFSKFKKALEDKNNELVIVANTATSPKEFQNYKDYARGRGLEVIVMVVENRHGGKDSHNVPEETLEKQEEKLRKSIVLR